MARRTAAGTCWEAAGGTGGAARDGPDGNILQPPSGSFVCFIKPLETLRRFTAGTSGSGRGGTRSAPLYGQISCNIEALMISQNLPPPLSRRDAGVDGSA